MRTHFNIEIDKKTYGVLVSQSKYSRHYKLAKNTFKRSRASLENELLGAFQYFPKLKENLLAGNSIE